MGQQRIKQKIKILAIHLRIKPKIIITRVISKTITIQILQIMIQIRRCHNRIRLMGLTIVSKIQLSQINKKILQLSQSSLMLVQMIRRQIPKIIIIQTPIMPITRIYQLIIKNKKKFHYPFKMILDQYQQLKIKKSQKVSQKVLQQQLQLCLFLLF